MYRTLKGLCSIVLALIMLANMLPMSVFAQDFQEFLAESAEITSATVSTETQTNNLEAAPATIVTEIEEKRTEFSKEFLMSNGLHMAAVYANAVHYETADGWEEIDNTLKAAADGSYHNTAGVWDVTFPNQLGGSNAISVTKDGYTLSFAMAGELRGSTGHLTAQTQTLNLANHSAIAPQTVDTLAMQEAAEHPQTVPVKLHSRVLYADVYADTHVQYDLESNKVKESIVLESYDASRLGYSYTLNVGQLIPTLQEDGSILFYDAQSANVIFVMPAPYLVDSDMVQCNDIQVQLAGKGSTYILTYTLPQSWLAAEDRAWPVILDPVVAPALSTANIKDKTVGQKRTYTNDGILDAGYYSSDGITRFYLKYANLPGITSSDIVVNATIQLFKPQNSGTTASVEVHKVSGDWDSSTITWEMQDGDGVEDSVSFDPNIEDYAIVKNAGTYKWVVTDIVRDWYANENTGMMFKVSDEVENAQVNNYKQFYSSDYADYATSLPMLSIVFRNNNGLESYWDYTSQAAGRAGSGYVNTFTGNLVWTRADMGFGGNRMPVTISHVYNLNDSTVPSDSNNANDTGGNAFGMGNGWRTNYNQLVYQWAITDGTEVDGTYYIWEDADGTDHYFKQVASYTYEDEDNMQLVLTTNGSGTKKYCITDKAGGKYYFDTLGRLTELQNNQATPSSIALTYVGDTKSISTITDGAGRVYRFVYIDGYLSEIEYLGTGTTALEDVAYNYTDANLTGITDIDGETVSFTYDGSKLKTAQDIDGYKLTYTYNSIGTNTWQPYRVESVEASHGTELGGKITFEYGHNQTKLTDHDGNVQITQFNDLGNPVSVRDDQGRAQFGQYAKNSTDETGKANQLTVSSKLQDTVTNLLSYSSFESGSDWSTNSSTLTVSRSTAYAYAGSYALKLSKAEDSTASAYSPSYTLAPDETVTFSAWVKGASNYGYIALEVNGTVQEGPGYAFEQDWTRLEMSYTNDSDQSVTLRCCVFTETSGETYVDCVQLEKTPTASRFNLIENGDFRYTGTPASGWSGANLTASDIRTTATSPAPQLDGNVIKIVGDPNSTKQLSQQIEQSGIAGDTFVIGGWAKGNSAPMVSHDSRERAFRLRLTFNNTDNTTTDFDACFNPDTDDWQFAAQTAMADKAYTSITVQLQYNYNVNTVYFDGIQLFREVFGSSYTYDEEGNVTSVTDLQKQKTEYEYDEANNLTKVIQNGETKMTYTYDTYHNMLSSTSSESVVCSYAYDAFGNNIKVAVGGEESGIVSTAQYTADGNRLVSTTDALNKTTTYDYDENTNELKSVKYPEDEEENKTTYTYDALYRLSTAMSTTDTGKTLSAIYGYTDDLLTSIATPKTTYTFTYGNFGLRESVKIGDQSLASYRYTADRNRRLSALDYGNQDSLQYTYDEKGRLTQQTYEDGDTVTYAYDNTGALATVTDSATGIKTTYYYDFTDRLAKYTETGANYSHSVDYTFDEKNNLTAHAETINGTTRTASFVYDDDNRIESMTADGTTVVYTRDAYGRLSQKVTKQGEATVKTETFTYTPNAAATSGQVASHTICYGTYTFAYTYTYDDNGNIVSLSETISSTTSSAQITRSNTYTYDTAGQLLRENNGFGTNAWSYDNAGNIVCKGVPTGTGTEVNPSTACEYTYGVEDWGDLLTAYNGTTITYDDIGNPLTYGSRTYTWEHGRELSTLTENGTTWTYTYNADGLRTSRTNGTTTYTYIYDGSQLSRMTVDGHTLDFTYDASGIPLTVKLDGTVYYYATNLQGDVIGIFDSTGNQKAMYSYDAWGIIGTMPTQSAISIYNPLRYRGYVYDPETELYYLQSRYYDPEIGRFINADGLVSTGQGFIGNNMFAYCLNSPTSYTDYAGARCVPARCDVGPYLYDSADLAVVKNKEIIIEAATEYNVDPEILAGCIYAEQRLNYDWIDELTDVLCYRMDTSVGVAQVKISTASMLIKKGYVNGKGISGNKELAKKLETDTRFNIYCAAAYLGYLQDQWSPVCDISNRPDILGTLYNLGERKPHTSPKANAFGEYVQNCQWHMELFLD